MECRQTGITEGQEIPEPMNSYLLVALVSEFVSGARILAGNALPPSSTLLANHETADRNQSHNRYDQNMLSFSATSISGFGRVT